MKLHSFVLLIWGISNSSWGYENVTADDTILARIRVLLQRPVGDLRYMEGAKVWEVTDGTRMFYVTSDLRFSFTGSLLDMQNRRDLTFERKKEIAKRKFDAINFDTALKYVEGTGKHKIVLFADPNCMYCKKIEREVRKLKNVSLYIFMAPLLTEDSAKLIDNIWCADNPSYAWTRWIIFDIAPPEAACPSSPAVQNKILATAFEVRATPTLLLPNGSRLTGYQSADALRRIIDTVSASSSLDDAPEP